MIAETLEANGKSRVRGLYDDFRSSKRRRRNGRRQSVDFFIILNLNYKKYFLSKIYASSFYVYFFNQNYKNNFTYFISYLTIHLLRVTLDLNHTKVSNHITRRP